MSDAARDWRFSASNYVGEGDARPVRVAVNRRLKGGRLDFVALTEDEAIGFVIELLEAVARSRRSVA